MYRLRAKLRKLQHILRPLDRRFTDIHLQIQQARKNLTLAHEQLAQNLFDNQAIEKVKQFTYQVIHFNHMEESILL